MSELKNNGEETLRVVQESDGLDGVPPQMMQDAFAVLLVTMLREPFMSGDIKVIIMHSAINKLATKYSVEDMDKFKAGMSRVTDAFMKRNDFMG